MTVELTPMGVRCQLSCPYCYQSPMRDAGNFAAPGYDVDAMLKALDAEGSEFTVFGGEPLLTPIEDLERIWRWGYERYGRNGVQTNGALITDRHIALFLRYRVHVGISVDGPGELNDTRWAGSVEKTRESTERTHDAIRRLCAAGHPPSIIATLTRINAAPDRLPRFKAWLRELDGLGVTSARIHILEVDHEGVREHLQLSQEETTQAFLELAALESELPRLRFDIFRDIENLLRGEDGRATCTWRACDPYTTSAVQGIDGEGNKHNCGRTNKEGVGWIKADRAGFERYLALYHTPQSYGGCQGCRFFVACKGQCPGEGMGGDWRNRSENCPVYVQLFEHVERRLLDRGVVPVSLDPDRPAVERRMIDAWARGENLTIAQALAEIRAGASAPTRRAADHRGHGDSHGDHTDHGDSPHGDRG